MRDIVYFDLETKRSSHDVGGWANKCDMGMSIGVTYSTRLGEYRIYTDARVHELVEQLRRADLVVGFNILHFDYEVLMGYTTYDLREICQTRDLMADLLARLGHRLGLDACSQGCFGIGKTAEGMDAIRWWREGRLIEIAEYCCFDVKCTKLVHEFGAQHGRIHYMDRLKQKKTVPVEWRM